MLCCPLRLFDADEDETAAGFLPLLFKHFYKFYLFLFDIHFILCLFSNFPKKGCCSVAKKKKKKSILPIILLVVILIIAAIMLFGDDEEEDYYDSVSDDSSDYSFDYDPSSEYDSFSDYDSIEEAAAEISEDGNRAHYVDVSSSESVTMMVYMIGSDLESENGCGTTDIQEMLSAELGNVKIALQTGGCSTWMSGDIDDYTVQRFILDDSGMTFAADLGTVSMVQPSTLSSFVSWAKSACPADRYMLVFWDHGGGTVGGFGSDELFDDASMSLAELASALQNTNVKFDIIGFDACLMATVETAYALEPFADYLLASEEYEPGNGWFYTDFLTLLNDDPSIGTVQLCKKAIDDYHDSYGGGDITLSVVDLAGIARVYEGLSEFLANAQMDIQSDSDRFKQLSKAISKARTYCDGEIDQIDMLDMVQRTEFSGKQELINAISSCVKYHNNSDLTGSNGLAMYFPYSQKDTYGSSRNMLNTIRFSTPIQYYNYFLSIMSSSHNRSSNSVVSSSQTDYSQEAWYEEPVDFDYGEESDDLYLDETPDGFVLKQDDDFWDKINDIELQVMISDDGEGYYDLGSDNAEIWTDDGDLLLDFDYTWVSINGHIVPFYANPTETKPSGSIVYSGKVYAMLNGKDKIALELKWEPQDGTLDNLKAWVEGYRVVNTESTTYGKGLKTLNPGDKLTFLIDYYPEDEDEDVITEEMDFTISVTSQSALKVDYTDLSNCTVVCWYHFTDIYGSDLYTEAIELSTE